MFWYELNTQVDMLKKWVYGVLAIHVVALFESSKCGQKFIFFHEKENQKEYFERNQVNCTMHFSA